MLWIRRRAPKCPLPCLELLCPCIRVSVHFRSWSRSCWGTGPACLVVDPSTSQKDLQETEAAKVRVSRAVLPGPNTPHPVGHHGAQGVGLRLCSFSCFIFFETVCCKKVILPPRQTQHSGPRSRKSLLQGEALLMARGCLLPLGLRHGSLRARWGHRRPLGCGGMVLPPQFFLTRATPPLCCSFYF